jgi:hypothetical protein
MGGEQEAVLVYGPKRQFTFMECINLFQIINKKEWVINYITNENHTYTVSPDEFEDEETINVIFEQEYEKNHYIIDEFLHKTYGLGIVYSTNVDWSQFYIGLIVDDYEKFKFKKSIEVIEFCEIYNFEKPTFFAGIIGEQE